MGFLWLKVDVKGSDCYKIGRAGETQQQLDVLPSNNPNKKRPNCCFIIISSTDAARVAHLLGLRQDRHKYLLEQYIDKLLCFHIIFIVATAFTDKFLVIEAFYLPHSFWGTTSLKEIQVS